MRQPSIKRQPEQDTFLCVLWGWTRGSSYGGTLIELVLSISLCSIVVLASIQGLSARQHFIEQTQTLVWVQTAIRVAIQWALLHHTQVVIRLDPVQNSGFGQSLWIQSDGRVVWKRTLSKKSYVQWHSSLGHNNGLVVTAAGNAKGQQGRYRICSWVGSKHCIDWIVPMSLWGHRL